MFRANGGSLFTLIQDSDSGLNQDYVKCVIYKILLALESMHAINIVHLDIKVRMMTIFYLCTACKKHFS